MWGFLFFLEARIFPGKGISIECIPYRCRRERNGVSPCRAGAQIQDEARVIRFRVPVKLSKCTTEKETITDVHVSFNETVCVCVCVKEAALKGSIIPSTIGSARDKTGRPTRN